MALKVFLALTPAVSLHLWGAYVSMLSLTHPMAILVIFLYNELIKLHFKSYNKFWERPLKYSAKTGNSTLSSRKCYLELFCTNPEHTVTTWWMNTPHSNRQPFGCIKTIGLSDPANLTWEYPQAFENKH